jgi:hypothetical protein
LGPGAPDTAPFERAAAERGMDLQVLKLVVAALAELYEAPLALIRPDQIVAWRGNDAHSAEAVLAQVLGFAATGDRQAEQTGRPC